MSEEIVYRPIGVVRSEHLKPEDTPIQPVFAVGCKGSAEVLPEYAEGLSDLDGFSHVYLLYHFDRCKQTKLKTKPFLQDTPRGVFSTRGPWRPNRIGMSIVRLKGIEGNILHLLDVDVLDGTPLLDIKPYSKRFDCIVGTKNGWQDLINEDAAKVRGKRGYKGPASEEAK